MPEEEAIPLFDTAALAEKVEKEFQKLHIHFAILHIFNELATVNHWLAEQAPWNLKGDEHAVKRRRTYPFTH